MAQKQIQTFIPADLINGFSASFSWKLVDKLYLMLEADRFFKTSEQVEPDTRRELSRLASALCKHLAAQLNYDELSLPEMSEITARAYLAEAVEFLTLFEVKV